MGSHGFDGKTRVLLALAAILFTGSCAFFDHPTLKTMRQADRPPTFTQRVRNADRQMREGRAQEAALELQAALRMVKESDPAAVEVHARLGTAYRSQGQNSEARQAFERGVKIAENSGRLGPEASLAYEGLTLCLIRDKEYSRAVEAARKAVSSASPDGKRASESLLRRAVLEEAMARGSGIAAEPVADTMVHRITIAGNRVDEKLLRARLPFKEGGMMRPGDMADARESLAELKLFRKIIISTAPLPGGIGAEVSVLVKDGWYILPQPLYIEGSGGRKVGLSVSVRNALRKAETFSALGQIGKRGDRGAVGASWEGHSLSLHYGRHEYQERSYFDGAYSSVWGMGLAPDEDQLVYGDSDRYRRNFQRGGADWSFPILRRRSQAHTLTGTLGWEFALVRYSDPTRNNPYDTGHQSKMSIGFRFGPSASAATEGFTSGLGFWHSEVEEKTRLLAQPRLRLGGAFQYNAAAPWTGSKYHYAYGVSRVNAELAWGMGQKLTLEAGGGYGTSLTPSRELATGPQAALNGIYAREFRGHGVAGTSLGYTHSLWPTKFGDLRLRVFLETARAFFVGDTKNKHGMGFGFTYRLWRIPIPFGFSYTHSVEDSDGQLVIGVGGRF